MNHEGITLEAAVQKASYLLPEINHCTEYTGAYMFSNTSAPLSLGGPDSPVVILKESGRAIGQTDFYDDPSMDITVISEFDI